MRKFAIALVALGMIVASCASKEESETVQEPAPVVAPEATVTEPQPTTAPAEEVKVEKKTTKKKTHKHSK